MLRGAEFIRPSSARRYSGPLVWLDRVTYNNPARRDLFSREGQRGTERHQKHERRARGSQWGTVLTRPRQRTLPRLHKHMLEGPVLHVPTQSLHSVPRHNEDLRSQPKQGHGGPDQSMRGGLDTEHQKNLTWSPLPMIVDSMA